MNVYVCWLKLKCQLAITTVFATTNLYILAIVVSNSGGGSRGRTTTSILGNSKTQI